MATSYCEAAQLNPFHKSYHDTEYGFPLRDDAGLFERPALEINQAGLSWLTILKKKDAFHKAFEGFEGSLHAINAPCARGVPSPFRLRLPVR